MDFEIGKEYSKVEIARAFGYSESGQSMRGGLFFRNNTLIMFKDEPGKNYEDRWDPEQMGTLTYFATLKGSHKNKNDSIIDLPINSGANKQLRDGDCPIILFCNSNKSYRYMGEFERTDTEPIHIVKNGYYVPGFQLRSKNLDLIESHIDNYLNNADKKESWSKAQIEAFSRMYFEGEISLDDTQDIREIAICLDKSVITISNAIRSLSDDSLSLIPEKIKTALKKAILERKEEIRTTSLGYDAEISTTARVGQASFRQKLDKIFKSKCCLTGINRREALVASHVYPWKMSNSYQKVDPNNGLLLNSFHDSLFDKHLMTVRVDGTVEYLDSLKQSLGYSVYNHMCEPYDEIDFPNNYHPWKEAFDHHNKIFEEKSEQESHS